MLISGLLMCFTDIIPFDSKGGQSLFFIEYQGISLANKISANFLEGSIKGRKLIP